ncbi:lysophospholipid acyltransferase family protein [bacterium]|nr:lysophospholipid acyltransferase family protein [bacterium]
MTFPRWYYGLRNAPLHGITHLIIWLVRILPERAAFAMGKGLALLVWRLMPRWRRTARRNLEIFFGGKLSFADRTRIGREAAVNLSYHVIEFIRMGYIPVEDALDMVVETEGIEHYQAALKEGRGVIGLGMHYGNWELSGAYMASRMLPALGGYSLYAVGKEQRDAFFDRCTFPWRARYDIKNIYAGDKVASTILRALKQNALLGLLADQNGGKNGTFAPFAGTMASTVAGPAALALKTGAPLLLTFCRRISPGKLQFIVKPPLDTSNTPGYDPTTRRFNKEAVVEVLSRINEAYEGVIRDDPTQWLWGHKRWKTRPPGEEGIY